MDGWFQLFSSGKMPKHLEMFAIHKYVLVVVSSSLVVCICTKQSNTCFGIRTVWRHRHCNNERKTSTTVSDTLYSHLTLPPHSKRVKFRVYTRYFIKFWRLFWATWCAWETSRIPRSNASNFQPQKRWTRAISNFTKVVTWCYLFELQQERHCKKCYTQKHIRAFHFLGRFG